MVVRANGLLSDVSVRRSQNQNGSCSSIGPSALPLKWKHRNISAVRDFPPGCGPTVQPVIAASEEPNSSSSLVNIKNEANDTGTEVKQVESLPLDVSKSTEDGKMELQKGDNQAIMVKDEISGPVNAVMEVDDNGGSFIKESVRKMKFYQRRVSAVRDFPPYCGLNATEPTKEERIRINGKRNSGIKIEGSERNEKLTDPVVVGGEESNGSVKDETLHKTHSNESNESLMENQDQIADKDDELSKGKTKVVDDESNVNVEKLKQDVDKRSNTASQIIKKVCQDLVVYTRDKDSKKSPLIDESDEDEEDEEENLEDESESFHNSETQEVMPIRSVAPIEENIKNDNGENKKVSHKKLPKKRSLDDNNNNNNNLGFVKGDRSVVIGLMAPSFSPEVLPSITPKKSKSEVIPSIKPKKSKSKEIPPKKSKSEEIPPSITPNESTSKEIPPSITPNESTSKEIPSIKPKKSKSKDIPSKKSKSEEIPPSITPKKSKSKEIAPSKTPKKSKSKKVKVEKESSESPYTGTLDMVVKDEEASPLETEEQGDEIPNSNEVDVGLPPFGPRSSNSARNRIRETLRLFQALCRKLLQGEESKTSEVEESKPVKRVDLVARSILQKKGKTLDRGIKTYGSIPGVEVGDEFQYRVELALVGLHWPFQGGIDYIKHGKKNTPVAVSVVASGGYDNEVNKPECLIYSGSGGIGKDKQVEDQKLERGNVALKNNIDLKLPVRVIRGYKGSKSTESSSSSSSDSKSKIQTTYIYDGLYTVEKYWQQTGQHGNLVFKFELKRIPGQPELALREVKSKKFKTREGLCVDDITDGKEKIRVSAVNTIDDEKPPSFNYITKIVYPDWYHRPVPPTGCDCVGRCSTKRCKCAAKNGGEIPYNHNGAIVEAKPLVYECGPSCKCPPSCYNRVTQRGMKIQLEIFKTESRGWGVRSLTSISSGSFICEYVGELLEDTEAEKRTSNDEYLFDIGQNYSDTGMGLGMDAGTGVDAGKGMDGFTIDAAHYGNVGRFINHSCTPNLYAQNVLYDQEDKRMPHIMLFAAENIPPLQELTYHYNYAVDTVHDSDGNIKVKRCFCGSSECTGRLY